MKSWDVIVIGGGLIGLSLAIELRRSGASVLVAERGEAGREASHAAGGMIADCLLETAESLYELAAASARLYPQFVNELEVVSGHRVDLRSQGTVLFPTARQVSEHADFISGHGLPAPLAELEPALHGARPPESPPPIFLKERSVDPRALTVAAIAAAKKLGVDVSSGEEVKGVIVADGAAQGVRTRKTSYRASRIVNCAGAWSGQIAPHGFPTRPVKGQMLCLLSPRRELLQHVVRSHEVYLVPRSDGRIVVGSTLEEAGFDKRTDTSAIKGLHQAAINLVPGLRDAKILEDWAGLRPGTPDGLPILGMTETPGYFVATGHFRDGILLAPITARVMTQVIEDRKPDLNLAAFSAGRFEG